LFSGACQEGEGETEERGEREGTGERAGEGETEEGGEGEGSGERAGEGEREEGGEGERARERKAEEGREREEEETSVLLKGREADSPVSFGGSCRRTSVHQHEDETQSISWCDVPPLW